MRPLALFLAVGFFSSAVFLTVPDERPRLRAAEAGEARENCTAGAVLLAGAESIGGHAASRAPALGRINPRRYDEVVKEELILEVVREDGRPIAGATVSGVHEDMSLHALTDEAGRATLRTFHEIETEITVSRSDFVFQKRTIRLDPGVQRFVVPTRSSLKGRVQIRGQVPREPVAIGLVWSEGSRLSTYGFLLLSTSDSQGNVEFFNLPADWTGTLNPPKGYRRNEGPFFTPGVPVTYFSRPPYDDGQPFITEVLTPVPSNNRIANYAILGGVPGDIDVGTFLNPEAGAGSIIATYEAPPLDKPGITIVDVEPENEPKPPEFGVHDVGVINLISMREIKLRIVDGSGAALADAQGWITSGAAGPGSSCQVVWATFWVDDDKTIDQLRESFWVGAPAITHQSWVRVDGDRVVLTESGNDEITVTVHDRFPVEAPVTLDVTSDQ